MAWYIKFQGVDGESAHTDHKKWCDLDSVSTGIHKVGGGATGASRRAGAAEFDDITCSKEWDKASPKIQENMAGGKVYDKVELHCTATYGNAQPTYLKYELKNAQVTSYNVSCSGEGRPSESFSLNFEAISVTYDEYEKDGKKKGAIAYTWKVEEAEK